MDIYNYKITKRNGEELLLNEYRNKVILIVNTATGCGFTPQYAPIEEFYKKYHEDGLEILDIPCNQFGNQAPGNDEEIHEFCTLHYNTKFPQMKKSDVNGENEDPLYTYLKKEMPEAEVNGLKDKVAFKGLAKMSKTAKEKSDITWNFEKFLVDREGKVVGRFTSFAKPEDLDEKIGELI